MATFNRNEKGIAWLKITWVELLHYSGNPSPICDECLQSLAGKRDIVLLPILNEAYCSECGAKVLARLVDYPEDRPLARRREQFWLNYFGLKEVLQ